jgi:hypothetical protein
MVRLSFLVPPPDYRVDPLSLLRHKLLVTLAGDFGEGGEEGG